MGDKNKKSVFGCPYCIKKIPFDAVECLYCGTDFGSQTIKILRPVVNQPLFTADEDRREVNRIPKQFKIVYNSGSELINTYLDNISVGGVFIPTENPLGSGARFHMKITLPNGEQDIEVNYEVVWVREKEVKTPSGKFPPGGELSS